MRKLLLFIALVLPATAVYANPTVRYDPTYFMGPIIFYGGCFSPEVLLVVTILFFCHMAVVPLLIVLFTGNLLIYFFIFQPILSATGNVLVSEAIIVFIEGAFIKMLSSFDRFQMDDFKGLKWITAFIIAAAGNYLSYYSGIVIGE